MDTLQILLLSSILGILIFVAWRIGRAPSLLSLSGELLGVNRRHNDLNDRFSQHLLAYSVFQNSYRTDIDEIKNTLRSLDSAVAGTAGQYEWIRREWEKQREMDDRKMGIISEHARLLDSTLARLADVQGDVRELRKEIYVSKS
jgi:GTP-sensing pleiotropic transcriptional regulator CodY